MINVLQPTGIKDSENTLLPVFFPNPVSDELHIRFNSPEEVEYIKLYDINGMVAVLLNDLGKPVSEVKMDMSKLVPGFYFIEIKTTGQIIKDHILVQ